MAKKEDTIHIIRTGGTIDSYYDGTKDTVVPRKHSIIPTFINSLRLGNDTKFSEICMKDSRSLNESDLKKILKTVEKSHYKKIIIVHGTYTMPDTARYLEVHLARKDQTVILTGSFIPIEGVSPSDGPFNLGYAVSKVQDAKPGVCVCMNGQVLKTNEAAKLVSEGRFYSIFGENKS